MKYINKLFGLLLLSLLFIACDDDNDSKIELTPYPISDWKGDYNNPNDPIYKPGFKGHYNPLVGMWKVKSINGSDQTKSMIYTFKKDFTYNLEIEDVPAPYISYSVNNEQFRVGDILYKFRFSDVDLYKLNINNGTETHVSEFISQDIMSVKGDWNNKNDPNYVENRIYNPIKGVWRLTADNGNSPKETLYYKFSEDLYWSESLEANQNYTDGTKFSINDKAVRIVALLSEQVRRTFAYNYKVEEYDGKKYLTLTCTYPYEDDPITFEHVGE